MGSGTRAGPPWTVEVTRGGFVESVHAVSVVLLDPDGAVVLAAGDQEVPVYGRSALKPAQAVAALEHAARSPDVPDVPDLTDEELAIAAGSHSGEPMHLDAVRGLLARHGLGADDLQCPPDLPLGAEAAHALLAAGGRPSPLTMNCSGKHAAMLTVARRDPGHGYLDAASPLQHRVRAVVDRLAGPVLAASVDGCGAPAFATPLPGLARLARAVSSAAPGTPEHRVGAAMRARPDLVAGTGRLDTVLMTTVPGTLSKIGAEGVLLAGLPDGHALALKVHDGAGRAVGPVLLEILRRRRLEIPPPLAALASPAVHGGCRPVGDLRVPV